MDEVETVDGEVTQVAGSYNEYVGTVDSGTTITNMSHITGTGTDRNYAAGASTRVYVAVTSERENRLVEGIAVHANQDGTLKTNAVTTAVITDNSVTPAKISARHYQTDNANSIANVSNGDLIQQYGWGQIVGDGTAKVEEAVTFGTAFTTILGVVCSPLGAKSSGAASDITGLDLAYASEPYTMFADDITNSGFNANLLRADSETFGSGDYFGYSWIAWGL
jgi:hypothetical protein